MAISSTGAFWTLDLVKKVPMFFPDTMLWMARSSCPLQMTTVVPLSRAQEAALTWKKNPNNSCLEQISLKIFKCSKRLYGAF